ncbi:prepilin peptidase [Alicyclobacillus fastidiosus]|uniref:Prepilin peptidase n=1 Tax=Alicyclobacillus fastidiosus TaxID=392011 RepID=A0ABY6ZMS8_9BACL|nr:A24 family peptidase [Alicyclobacillus fastidiosus]WAH44250.1 prepilin peptidase [Alicyclobacillus fastidiosus]GMA60572.1 prepilin peptidase [Alicyclobacillus fastidiosus]
MALQGLMSLYLFFVGAVFGSFATLVGDRIPSGQSIVRPGSSCNHCGLPLRAWHLIPVVSWVVLRGRCTSCRAPIPMRYPAQEALLGGAVVLSVWHRQSVLLTLTWCGLWFVLTVAISSDFTKLIVPNWLTYPSAVVLYISSALSCGSFLHPVFGMLGGFAMIFVVHLISGGKMGLGDAKLYLSIGAVLGVALTVESFILACLFGAVMGGILRLTGHIGRKQYVPFVPFIALGVAGAQFVFGAFPQWYLHHILGVL